LRSAAYAADPAGFEGVAGRPDHGGDRGGIARHRSRSGGGGSAGETVPPAGVARADRSACAAQPAGLTRRPPTYHPTSKRSISSSRKLSSSPVLVVPTSDSSEPLERISRGTTMYSVPRRQSCTL